jgi:hypothetical protein
MTSDNSIRTEVRMLSEFGPLAPEREWVPARLEALEAAIDRVTAPVTLAEAQALLTLLDRESQDSVYSLIWTVVSLLETAPGWPPRDALATPTRLTRPWFVILRDRTDRS